MKKILVGLFVFLFTMPVYAGTITRYLTFTTNSQVTSTNLNGNFDNIVNECNGGLDNTNIDTAAGYRLYEILGATPAAGTEGRLVYNTATDLFMFDSGSAFTAFPSYADTVHKVFLSTRLMDASSGSVPYTSVGFKPRAIMCFATVNTTAGRASWGMGTASTYGSISDQYQVAANTYSTSTSWFLSLIESSIADQSATITSMDNDGFTLYWTRGGSTASGTASLLFLCFR